MNTSIAIKPARGAGMRLSALNNASVWIAGQWAIVRGLLRAVSPADARLRGTALVRALADTSRKSDPGFASDLYAAVDRHDRARKAQAALAKPAPSYE